MAGKAFRQTILLRTESYDWASTLEVKKIFWTKCRVRAKDSGQIQQARIKMLKFALMNRVVCRILTSGYPRSMDG